MHIVNFLHSVMIHFPFLIVAPESSDGKSMEEILYSTF